MLAYPLALLVTGVVLLFAVAGSDDLGQPLAGIITVAAMLAALAGGGLLVASMLYRRREAAATDDEG